MEVYYKNHLGEKLGLVGAPYFAQTGDFLDYAWSYSTNQYGRISSFERPVQEKELTLTVKGGSHKGYRDALERFYRTVEVDIAALQPGRLYVDGTYLLCYIFGSTKVEWEEDGSMADLTVKVVTDYPFWIKESTYQFREPKDDPAMSGLDFPADYPNDYASEVLMKYIKCSHFLPSNFEMVVYGPCVNPSVEIASQKYQVFTEVAKDEYLEINSYTGTVVRAMTDGTLVNEFNSRNKEYEIFKKIPPGTSSLYRNGTFGLDLTLFQERSEPEWAEDYDASEENGHNPPEREEAWKMELRKISYRVEKIEENYLEVTGYDE